MADEHTAKVINDLISERNELKSGRDRLTTRVELEAKAAQDLRRERDALTARVAELEKDLKDKEGHLSAQYDLYKAIVNDNTGFATDNEYLAAERDRLRAALQNAHANLQQEAKLPPCICRDCSGVTDEAPCPQIRLGDETTGGLPIRFPGDNLKSYEYSVDSEPTFYPTKEDRIESVDIRGGKLFLIVRHAENRGESLK